jgi:hypothetical protein
MDTNQWDLLCWGLWTVIFECPVREWMGNRLFGICREDDDNDDSGPTKEPTEPLPDDGFVDASTTTPRK